MSHTISVSIDVADMTQAIESYTQALPCELKKTAKGGWAVLSLGEFDLHLREVAADTDGVAGQKRSYARHWTPVHLDFGVPDVDAVAATVERLGGTVEGVFHEDYADIAHCADPFGHGFCVIRE